MIIDLNQCFRNILYSEPPTLFRGPSKLKKLDSSTLNVSEKKLTKINYQKRREERGERREERGERREERGAR
jgi:hypothetical protein